MHRRAAEVDALTGVATRRRGIEVIERFFRLAQRQQRPVSIAAIDLDHFKQINDTHGHLAGDAALRRVSTLLARAFRGEDVVARWGGEEFVVAMYAMPCDAAVHRLAEALEELREERLENDGTPITVTFSAGVAQFPRDGADLTAVYRVADAALSRAKQAGRNRVLATGSRAEPGDDVDVVVVDDDEPLAELVCRALETRGYSSKTLRDGVTALAALTGFPPPVRARVILLDVGLPGADGFTVLRALSAHGVLRASRVVMLTAHVQKKQVMYAMELGAADYIAKPFSVPKLMQRVRRAMLSI
jgi:diguanylate cyclase (GGDEF)-like protein